MELFFARVGVHVMVDVQELMEAFATKFTAIFMPKCFVLKQVKVDPNMKPFFPWRWETFVASRKFNPTRISQ